MCCRLRTTVVAAFSLVLVIGGVGVGLPGPATLVAAEGLEVSFRNGRVTVIADEVPVVAILDEWSRLGNTRFVDANALQLARQPVSLHIVDVPEAEALRILLRDAADFIAAPRAQAAEGASRFDRVLVMATSRARAGSTFAPSTAAASAVSPAQRGPMVAVPIDASEAASAQGTSNSEAMEELRRILPQPFDPSQTGQPPAAQPPEGAAPTAPRPGMPIASPDESAPEFFQPARPGRFMRPVRPQPNDR